MVEFGACTVSIPSRKVTCGGTGGMSAGRMGSSETGVGPGVTGIACGCCCDAACFCGTCVCPVCCWAAPFVFACGCGVTTGRAVGGVTRPTPVRICARAPGVDCGEGC